MKLAEANTVLDTTLKLPKPFKVYIRPILMSYFTLQRKHRGLYGKWRILSIVLTLKCTEFTHHYYNSGVPAVWRAVAMETDLSTVYCPLVASLIVRAL